MAKLCQRVSCQKQNDQPQCPYCTDCTRYLRERDRRINGDRTKKTRAPKTADGGQAGRTMRQRKRTSD